jgi:plasmid stability protein
MLLKRSIIVVSLLLVIFMLPACQTTSVTKTLKKIAAKPTYDPSTYGTAALFALLENNESSRADAVAAATELSKRSLTKDDAKRLVQILKTIRDEKVELAILGTIEARNLTFLLTDLVRFFPDASGPDSSAATAAIIVQYMPNDKYLFLFMKKHAICSEHANVRARAAKFLSSYGADAVPILVSAISKERSASAAMAMVDGLRDFGDQTGHKTLIDIQNDVARVYETDAHLGIKVTGDMVRAAAVRAVETMRSNLR